MEKTGQQRAAGHVLLVFSDLYTKKGISYSREHIGRLEKVGQFPKRVKFCAGGRSYWVEAEIDEFIADLVKARGQQTNRKTSRKLLAVLTSWKRRLRTRPSSRSK